MNQNILIIEDQAEVRKALMIELTHGGGYDCIGASDKDEALNLLRGGYQPHLMLVDIMLPSGSDAGLDLLEDLKGHPQWKGIPVIMLSARVQQRAILDALRRGADDYLTKPYDPEDLLRRVQRVCMPCEVQDSKSRGPVNSDKRLTDSE